MSEINVRGLADLQKFLDELPAKMEKNVMRGAVRAGMTTVKAEAIATCPHGPASSSGAKKYKLYDGALRDSIRITTRAKGGTVSASVKIGGKLKNGADVWYARIIEYTGAAPHSIKAPVGHALSFGGGLYASVDHPGMAPKPFFRAALDHEAKAAVIAAGNYVKNRLATKDGLDTSAILVEGDES